MEQAEEKELLLKGKKRALRLLERKDYTVKELKERLGRDGYSGEMIEQIMDYLDSFHYLSDVRVAGSYIRCRMETTSRRKLEYMLRQKGISEEDIDCAMEENYFGDGDVSQEEVAVRNQLKKYHITEEQLQELSYEEKNKLAAKLYRKGFEQEKIRKVLFM